MGEYRDINFILGKPLRILLVTKCMKPARNRLHPGHLFFRWGLEATSTISQSFLDDISSVPSLVCPSDPNIVVRVRRIPAKCRELGPEARSRRNVRCWP
jgi:hypothetical protein